MIPISDQTKNAAVIGDPISHSLSPRLHNYLINKYKVDGLYLAFKVAPENLNLCLKSFAKIGLRGCNVTIPHKEAAFKLCHHLSSTALATKAVNTIIIKEEQLYGDNSDGAGFIENLKENYPQFNLTAKKVVVIGAGGASRAICFALIGQKIQSLTIVNRSLQRSQILVEDFQKISGLENFQINICDWPNYQSTLDDCDLLINTTSLGMKNMPEMTIDISNLKKSALVADIIYKPLITDLLKIAKQNGHPILTGIGMLIHQALIGFEAWFETKPQVDQKLINLLLDD